MAYGKSQFDISALPVVPQWFSDTHARLNFLDELYAQFDKADHITFTETGYQVSIFDLSMEEQRTLKTSARKVVVFEQRSQLAPYFVK